MELTVLAVASVFLVGVGYAVVQKAQQSPLIVWTLICASLFVLSTRDLFQSRERGLPDSKSTESDSGRRTVADCHTTSDRRAAASRPPARADGGEDPPR